MIWRLILVVWIFALLIGFAVYFSDELFALLQQVWSLDKDGREKLKDLGETIATVLGILGAMGAFLKLVLAYIAGKKSEEKAKPLGNIATFEGPVKMRDFVQGDKNTLRIGGDDA